MSNRSKSSSKNRFNSKKTKFEGTSLTDYRAMKAHLEDNYVEKFGWDEDTFFKYTDAVIDKARLEAQANMSDSEYAELSEDQKYSAEEQEAVESAIAELEATEGISSVQISEFSKYSNMMSDYDFWMEGICEDLYRLLGETDLAGDLDFVTDLVDRVNNFGDEGYERTRRAMEVYQDNSSEWIEKLRSSTTDFNAVNDDVGLIRKTMESTGKAASAIKDKVGDEQFRDMVAGKVAGGAKGTALVISNGLKRVTSLFGRGGKSEFDEQYKEFGRLKSQMNDMKTSISGLDRKLDNMASEQLEPLNEKTYALGSEMSTSAKALELWQAASYEFLLRVQEAKAEVETAVASMEKDTEVERGRQVIEALTKVETAASRRMQGLSGGFSFAQFTASSLMTLNTSIRDMETHVNTLKEDGLPQILTLMTTAELSLELTDVMKAVAEIQDIGTNGLDIVDGLEALQDKISQKLDVSPISAEALDQAHQSKMIRGAEKAAREALEAPEKNKKARALVDKTQGRASGQKELTTKLIAKSGGNDNGAKPKPGPASEFKGVNKTKPKPKPETPAITDGKSEAKPKPESKPKPKPAKKPAKK